MRTGSIHGDAFSNLVHQILVVEKSRPVRDVAAATGMEYANFHARVIGRTHFKAEEVSRLIREVPDPRLCDHLLRGTPFVAVPRPLSIGSAKEGAMHAAVQLASESLAAIEQIGDALQDGQLNPSGYEKLIEHVREAERAICNLRASLSSLAPRKVRQGDLHPAAHALETIG